MRCDECGTDNAAGSKFCQECGGRLELRCPSCSTVVAADAKFCSECGTDLRAGDSDAVDATPIADRRFVSVLFADLVAYTTLAESSDSDDVRDLLTAYFARARSIIEKYGGVVEKFIGDAIFGVWGADRTREDDAERAVRAGLELVTAIGALGDDRGLDELALRVGVMSGATTVGQGGNERTGMVVGDLVNTASRLQSVARPGEVLVGRATRDVTERSIAYEPRGELTLKGKSESVEAWCALRHTVSVDAESSQRMLPFVGREREMRLLTDWLDATISEGRAHLVAITGEAGIGKSRLVEEFERHVDGYADAVDWHRGRSPSYGDGIPMWSLIEMIRRRAGIREHEPEGSSVTRLRTMLAEDVDHVDDRQWIESWFAGLLGVGPMPSGGRSELLSSIRTFFQHVAVRGPTVLVFEDLHWADAGVVEFIDELVGRSTRAPILLIAIARPELLERHPGFGSRLRSSVHVALAGLSGDAMRSAVSEYLGDAAPDLVDRIVERAAGYPLYAVEILRMLRNEGALVEGDDGLEWRGDRGAVAIPETLQAVVGARLDRLDPDMRSVLQDAAVLGLTFQPTALAAVSDRTEEQVARALAALVRRDLLEIVDDPRSPERGQHRFVQGIIQEVAASRLGRAERRARHLAAAEWFGRDGDPELATVVAQHFLGAHAASPAGPERDELVERAVESLVGAAKRSADLHADDVALGLWDRAIELAGDDRRIVGWQLAANRSALALGMRDRALAYVDAAGDTAIALRDRDLTTGVTVARARTMNAFFDSPGAVRVIEPVYRSLEALDDPLSIDVATEMVRSYSLAVSPDEAVVVADRILPVVERSGDVVTTIEVLISRGTALTFGERSIEGLATLVGAHELAEREGLLDQALRAANNITALLGEVDVRAGALWAERMQALAERTGVREAGIRCEYQAAERAMRAGDLEASDAIIQQLLDTDLDLTWRWFTALLRAAIALRRGDEGALAAHDDAIAPFDGMDDPQLMGVVDGTTAVRHEFAGDWAAAGAAARRGGAQAPHALVVASHAHARLGLTRPLRPELAELLQAHVRGPIRDGTEALIDALDAAARGDHDEAAERSIVAVAALDVAADAEAAMRARACVILALGRDHPLAERCASELAAWIDRHDLGGWRAVYRDLLPADSARAAG